MKQATTLGADFAAMTTGWMMRAALGLLINEKAWTPAGRPFRSAAANRPARAGPR